MTDDHEPWFTGSETIELSGPTVGVSEYTWKPSRFTRMYIMGGIPGVEPQVVITDTKTGKSRTVYWK